MIATEATGSTVPMACRRTGMRFSATVAVSTGTAGALFLASGGAAPLSPQPASTQAARAASAKAPVQRGAGRFGGEAGDAGSGGFTEGFTDNAARRSV